MFANVIVDVPAKQTNRTFDYKIPDSMRGWVGIGSRVGVPFGPRVVQGFVVGLSETADVAASKLKPIAQVMDLVPPLTPELVELARWISRTYLCHEITALQAMIPGALKAKYERYVTAGDSAGEDDAVMSFGQLSFDNRAEIAGFVRSKGHVPLEQLLERFAEDGALIQQMIKGGELREVQTIKDRLSAKKVLVVFPPEDPAVLEPCVGMLPAGAKRQKEVLEYLIGHPVPVRLTELALELNVGAGTIKGLADKGWIELRETEVFRDPYAGREFKRTQPLPFTEEQANVFEPIQDALAAVRHEVFLLHGVTGSGKTEVYLQAIRQCLDQDREAIVLVPEISLTPQMVERFKGRFGSEVAVLHSRLSNGERYDEWRKIALKQVRVVIGARSAIFAPFTKLGLVIIDEEHETSYKQEDSPKYHAREVAIERAIRHNAAVVLGSATPSLESYYRASESPARSGAVVRAGLAQGTKSVFGSSYRLLTMEERVQGRPLPPVHVVDMREELKQGNRSMFSRALYKAIEERLEKKQQAVLFLNRRGYSTFVMCRECGHTLGCPHCDISLTYHQSSHTVRCHYCGYAEPQAKTCPSCASEHIRFFGTGTQKVEEELGKLFPGIRVIRMDVDTTTEKGSHEKLLTMFRNREADILLGTQMVAKGLDFPDVTLVGVIAADTVLNLPDFRAGERTFQLLTQVAGRAGRHQLPGEVFVQTYTPEHYSIVTASGHDYEAFLQEELRMREAGGYPPYYRLILITISHEQIPMLVRTAESLVGRIKELLAQEYGIHDDSNVLGPVASPIPRIKDRYRFQCMIKYRGDSQLPSLVAKAVEAFDDVCRQHNVQIGIDVDPQLLM
ncbi:primosomal protein N' [Paenibacillus sp. MBLB4367]|uniref:primosomal protein N' n=1 Tax=Paenibacillus sp. MBLB4367 TaxID=3384767 RepID=UPI003908246D